MGRGFGSWLNVSLARCRPLSRQTATGQTPALVIVSPNAMTATENDDGLLLLWARQPCWRLRRAGCAVVRTKFAKTFRTFFMPSCEDALDIVAAWIVELERDHLWGRADPLFPATLVGLDENGGFTAKGLARQGWATTTPIRDIFRRAFTAADLPYFNPHSFRDMLVRHAMQLDLSPGVNEGLVAEPRTYRRSNNLHQLRCCSRASAR